MSATALQRGGTEGPTAASRWQNLKAETRKALRRPQFWFGLVILLPTIAFYIIFAFRPIILAFPLSFQAYNLIDAAKSKWVGLQNFRDLFRDPVTIIATKNTIYWALWIFCFTLPVCFAVSFCVANVSHFRTFYQGLIYLPNVISLVAIILLFRMLLDPDIGQVNQLLRSLHLPTSRFLSDESSAMATMIVLGTWKGMGGTVIIIAAGMLNVPVEYYEAAMIDGANSWQKFWHMTLPLISHTMLLIMVLTGIGALQELAGPLLWTGGGPGRATYLYNLLLYQAAFQNMQFGFTAAGALLQFAVILGLTLVQFKLIKPKWSY